MLSIYPLTKFLSDISSNIVLIQYFTHQRLELATLAAHTCNEANQSKWLCMGNLSSVIDSDAIN